MSEELENKDQSQQEEDRELTHKQAKFVTEYLIDFNGTRAARDSGFSKNCAAEIAYEYLRKPHIKAEITKRLNEAELGAKETTKMIGDIAKGNLNQYMVVRKQEYIPRIKKKLSEMITELEETKALEIEYAAKAGLDAEEMIEHEKEIKSLDRRILRFKLELKRNPKAFRMSDGEPVLIETADLDIAALSRDKEFAKIKSIKHTQHGVQVELQDAGAALTNMARIHSLFNDKLDLTTQGESLNKPMSQEEAKAFLEELKKENGV